MTPDQLDALEVARRLARLGVPLFLARPDPSARLGFALPSGWERAEPDPGVADAWQPGWALCAVTGRALDLVDVDPRSGGEAGDWLPFAYAVADTPSGGRHYWVAPLGVESLDGKSYRGVDVKSGAPDGRGRGFGFVAPTVRPSKVDGVARGYRWVEQHLELLGTAPDYSGARLRARIAEEREASRPAPDEPRRVPRSVAAREYDAALAALVADVARWQVEGWGGEAHAGLLRHSTHLARLAPFQALDAYVAAFRAAGAEPDEDDLAKMEQALAKSVPDLVVEDDELSAQERFWAGGAFEGGRGAGPPGPESGTFDFVTVERARQRRPPPVAAYGAFGGQRALFYDEGVHWLQGESESGKSWVALCHALDVLRAGRPVLVADYEDHEAAVLERLEQLGATDEEFGRLVYVAAVDVAFDHLRTHLIESVDRAYGLFVVDGVTSALTSAGLSGRDEQELTRWADELPRRVRSSQNVDHVVKAEDERRGMAVGTQAKKSVVSGTAFEVVCTTKFGRGTQGEIELRLQKDKRGGVRAATRHGVRLRFVSDAATGAVSLTVPSATSAAAVAAVDHERAARVLALAETIERAGVVPSGKRGASGVAMTSLAERGTPYDKSLWPEAWQTFLARAAVPEARYPAAVLDLVQNGSRVNGDSHFFDSVSPDDHAQDHQEIAG